LKIALQTIWEALPQEHKKQGGGELHHVPDCLHGCGCQLWSLQVQASAITLSVSKGSVYLHLIINKLGLFRDTDGKDNASNAEKWGL